MERDYFKCELEETIREMRELLEDDRRSLIESNSQIEIVNGKCSPVPGTLEPDVIGHLTQYNAAIERARKALSLKENCENEENAGKTEREEKLEQTLRVAREQLWRYGNRRTVELIDRVLE